MATISTTYTVTATHVSGQLEPVSMTQESQKLASVYAQRASIRGYDVVITETIRRGDEVTQREFLTIRADVKPPFGDAWERKAAQAQK